MNLKAEFVRYMPEAKAMQDGTVYISAEYETAIHRCACGCGKQTVTPFGDGGWTLTLDNGKVTLSPSIGNQRFNCKSHYLIQAGEVVWLDR